MAKIRQETATHVSEKHRISPIGDRGVVLIFSCVFEIARKRARGAMLILLFLGLANCVFRLSMCYEGRPCNGALLYAVMFGRRDCFRFV